MAFPGLVFDLLLQCIAKVIQGDYLQSGHAGHSVSSNRYDMRIMTEYTTYLNGIFLNVSILSSSANEKISANLFHYCDR